jgi:hypothetical protein
MPGRCTCPGEPPVEISRSMNLRWRFISSTFICSRNAARLPCSCWPSPSAAPQYWQLRRLRLGNGRPHERQFEFIYAASHTVVGATTTKPPRDSTRYFFCPFCFSFDHESFSDTERLNTSFGPTVSGSTVK